MSTSSFTYCAVVLDTVILEGKLNEEGYHTSSTNNQYEEENGFHSIS